VEKERRGLRASTIENVVLGLRTPASICVAEEKRKNAIHAFPSSHAYPQTQIQ